MTHRRYCETAKITPFAVRLQAGRAPLFRAVADPRQRAGDHARHGAGERHPLRAVAALLEVAAVGHHAPVRLHQFHAARRHDHRDLRRAAQARRRRQPGAQHHLGRACRPRSGTSSAGASTSSCYEFYGAAEGGLTGNPPGVGPVGSIGKPIADAACIASSTTTATTCRRMRTASAPANCCSATRTARRSRSSTTATPRPARRNAPAAGCTWATWCARTRTAGCTSCIARAAASVATASSSTPPSSRR